MGSEGKGKTKGIIRFCKTNKLMINSHGVQRCDGPHAMDRGAEPEEPMAGKSATLDVSGGGAAVGGLGLVQGASRTTKPCDWLACLLGGFR